MQPDSEDEAWRAIVENYGERPDLGPEAPTVPTAPPAPSHASEHGGRRPFEPEHAADDIWSEEDRFVPPPPPPLPRTSRDRYVAWAGVFGAPTVLLLCALLSIALPAVVSLALVAAFVGGFLYLVIRMPRGPRDPWDDGAQL